jgi:hypothetical protein
MRIFSNKKTAFDAHVVRCQAQQAEIVASQTAVLGRLRSLVVTLNGFINLNINVRAGQPRLVDSVPSPEALALELSVLYPFGFGSKDAAAILNPKYYKDGLDVVLLILGYLLGGDKDVAEFTKKDAGYMAQVIEVMWARNN